MVSGPVLILVAPWLVLSFEPIRRQVHGEQWIMLAWGGSYVCVPHYPFLESAALHWFAGICTLGLSLILVGIRIHRSRRFRGQITL